MTSTQKVTCQWFAKCETLTDKQVHHPVLGWVDCCNEHILWLGNTPSPTQFVPPLAAAVLARHPEVESIL